VEEGGRLEVEADAALGGAQIRQQPPATSQEEGRLLGTLNGVLGFPGEVFLVESREE
jgi:hypothetical protein